MPEYVTHPSTISGDRDGVAEVTAHQTAGLRGVTHRFK